MDLVTGAMGSLLLKLGDLLKEEYELHKGAKNNVEFLSAELTSMQTALLKIAEVPTESLDIQVRDWAGQVRDLSYDTEDAIDSFFVHVVGSASEYRPHGFRSTMEKIAKMFKRGKASREIAQTLEELKAKVLEVAARRDRYIFAGLLGANADAPQSSAARAIDPYLAALYGKVTDLVDIDGPSRELTDTLKNEGEEVKIVSIVGHGGLGKTTLARAVYNGLEAQFHCTALVSLSQKPDMTRILKDMLHQLDDQKFASINEASRDERQLIDALRKFLQDKRYLIVIDDIWTIESWITIRHALLDNSCASRIITTTRDFDIAQQVGGCYKLQPLTKESSELLFYGRIFGSKEKCPVQLVDVSKKILDKCGGLPLAIISIASLLASKTENPRQWDDVCNSMSCGLIDGSPHVTSMRKILSLSYYNLPSYLRTCLLYLCVYPEDYEIPRDDLIWKWISEGFITHPNKNIFLFEIGHNYFRELIDRGMILPCMDYTGDVTRCRVHDMVLDLICLLSSEENFVTILNHAEDGISSPSKTRRLSIHNIKEDHQSTPVAALRQSQVRSITTFPLAINLMPSLLSFGILRVLDISGCHLGKGSHMDLQDVGNLLHLRYLGLAGTGICELPAKIGMLVFLEVLDVRHNPKLKELPSDVYRLKRLVCLRVDGYNTRLPNGLANLTALKVLKKICATLSNVKELGSLLMLRELKIKFEHNASWELGKAFLESLSHLDHLQSLVFREYFPSMDLLGDSWEPPQKLRKFESVRCGAFSAMPAWIKEVPLRLSDLSELAIGFEELDGEDMQILGRLPALRRLWMLSGRQTQTVLTICADGYHCLRNFTLYCESPRQITFQPGAFPKVEAVLFNFSIRMARADGNTDFNFGLGNLVSLQQVTVGIDRDGFTVEVVKEAVDALKTAVDALHNRPSITLDIRPPIQPSELQKANGTNTLSVADEELLWGARRLAEKFRKYREETSSRLHPTC
ncbi:unnamed protein product [Alopecurus aequalis]